MTASFELHASMAKKANQSLREAVTHDENHDAVLAIPAYTAAISALVQYFDKFSETSEDFLSLTSSEKKVVRERVEKFRTFLVNARQRKQSLESFTIDKSDDVDKKLRTYEAQPLGTVLEQKRLKYQLQQQQQQQQHQKRQQQYQLFKSQIVGQQRRQQLSDNKAFRSVQPRQPAQVRGSSTLPSAIPRPPPPVPPVAPRQASVPQAPGNASTSNDPLRQNIENEILNTSPNVHWDDIYGLGDVKDALNEMMILPAQRPDLYSGLRAPGKGVLLAGPPGVGKTLIAKAVATNIGATFFSISASSLNSKYHGESERLVRTLFQVARERQPSFIFIDEIDSILGSRSDSEHEASRRLKTEFMVQFDGSNSSSGHNSGNQGSDAQRQQHATGNDRVFIMAATNRPQDLDDAVLRRFDRRIYVALPSEQGRLTFLSNLVRKDDGIKWRISSSDLNALAKRTRRFSGSDLKALCREASLMPLRELGEHVSAVRAEDVRPCEMADFDRAFSIVRPSSSTALIRELEKWNEAFGSKAVFKRFQSPGQHDSRHLAPSGNQDGNSSDERSSLGSKEDYSDADDDAGDSKQSTTDRRRPKILDGLRGKRDALVMKTVPNFSATREKRK